MKGRRHGETETARRGDEIIASGRSGVRASANCPACGSAASRDYARFCRVCGKILSEDYEPLDTLRSSYRLQGKSLAPAAQISDKQISDKTENLFEQTKNSAAMLAWAFVVYSLVPYLGILFCPGALLLGSVGVVKANRFPYPGGARISAYSIALSFVVFAFQIFLWWLLYLIPELGRNI